MNMLTIEIIECPNFISENPIALAQDPQPRNGTGDALTGRCITCRGTGRCHWCDGTGIPSYSILDALPGWAERLFKSLRKQAMATDGAFAICLQYPHGRF